MPSWIPKITSMLPAWGWAVMATLPALVIVLYFLKLRRTPLEVPSTYLWLKSIEDLRVNSLWQRLRQSLLLFLQLLLLVMLILALVRPSWEGTTLTGDRFIFLIDNSASMAATDVGPSRLEEARRRVGELIDSMRSGDAGMIVTFSNNAQVIREYTRDRAELKRRLQAVTQSSRTTSIAEALRVVAGLANPGRSATDARDFQVAQALPAQLLIFSDGKFESVPDFSLGNLSPKLIVLGDAKVHNVGIASFTTGRNPELPDQQQAFARLVNFGEATEVELELYLDGELIDADRLTLDENEAQATVFDVGQVDAGVLELRANAQDQLAIDDRAWTIVQEPRPARVLLVTPGIEPLELGFRTPLARQRAEVRREAPAFLQTPEYSELALAGGWDIVIFDRCAPAEPPQANTWYIGSLPPGDAWKAGPEAIGPPILDTDRAHPLMQLVEMGDVLIAAAKPLELPAGGRALIDSPAGALLGIAPRDQFEDVVQAFEIIGAEHIGTNWPLRISFPVFILNLLGYLGPDSAADGGSVRPGDAMALNLPPDINEVSVRSPAGQESPVARAATGRFVFSQTEIPGPYSVRRGEELLQRFSVNLFSPVESDVRPNSQIKIGDVEVAGTGNWEAARREGWKWLAALALVVLLIEWYIYNRRVYL